jgi:hypothetical protein
VSNSKVLTDSLAKFIDGHVDNVHASSDPLYSDSAVQRLSRLTRSAETRSSLILQRAAGVYEIRRAAGKLGYRASKATLLKLAGALRFQVYSDLHIDVVRRQVSTPRGTGVAVVAGGTCEGAVEGFAILRETIPRDVVIVATAGNQKFCEQFWPEEIDAASGHAAVMAPPRGTARARGAIACIASLRRRLVTCVVCR